MWLHQTPQAVPRSKNAYVNVLNKVNTTSIDDQISELDLIMASPFLLQLQVVQFNAKPGQDTGQDAGQDW